MSLLSRVFRRTPSLRTRVALATAIGAVIVVVIVCTVVWIGITNDRKEHWTAGSTKRAGFAILFPPRGLDEIPSLQRSRRRDQKRKDARSPNLTWCCPSSTVTPTPRSMAFATGWWIPALELMSVAVGATYDATIADTNNLHRRVLIIGVFSVGAATVLGWLLAAFAVRPLKRLAEQTRRSTPATRHPTSKSAAPAKPLTADAVNGMLQRI
jgi:two-component system sensor histidine kinase PrrB